MTLPLPAHPRLTPGLLLRGHAELLRHPVGGLRALAVGAVVGDVVAVLDDQELDRPGHLAREPLGVAATE